MKKIATIEYTDHDGVSQTSDVILHKSSDLYLTSTDVWKPILNNVLVDSIITVSMTCRYTDTHTFNIKIPIQMKCAQRCASLLSCINVEMLNIKEDLDWYEEM
jgi:hypothetical protein